MTINTLIFDLGYTLIYYDAPWPESFTPAGMALINRLRSETKVQIDSGIFLEAMQKEILKFPDPDEKFRQRTSREVVRKAWLDCGARDLSDQVFDAGIKAMFLEAEKHWLPENDTYSTLVEFTNQGYKLGIVSNAMDDPNVQRLVDKCGIRYMLCGVISSAAFGYAKPNPDIFNFALREFGSIAEETCMVGDSLEFDIAGAAPLGMNTIWITRRVHDPERKMAATSVKPNAVVKNLSEILPILKTWK